MAQWVKNLIAAAQVPGQAQWLNGLNDPVLPQLWLRFRVWPEIFHMPQVQPQIKDPVLPQLWLRFSLWSGYFYMMLVHRPPPPEKDFSR